VFGLVLGLAMGLALGFALGFEFGFRVWFPIGLAVGFVTGPAMSLTTGREGWHKTPAQVSAGIRGRLGDLIGEITSALRFGLVAGLAFGLVAGFAAAAAGTSWGQFTILRAWLAVRGRLPLRLMAFLDDAHRRGVLRQAGAAYQFRHARLQDHLAATSPTAHPDHG
jgi:hypothetical protein